MYIKKTQLQYVTCRLNSYQTPVYKFSMPSVLVQFARKVHRVMSLLHLIRLRYSKFSVILAVFEDVCTSKPQRWHKPRDDKIKLPEIQSLQVGSYKKCKVMTESEKDMSSKFLKSTFYNPLRGIYFGEFYFKVPNTLRQLHKEYFYFEVALCTDY